MTIQTVKGVEVIYPDRITRWNHIIDSAKKQFKNHNYKEIKIPIMEFTEVFSRGIGDETDIVSKEMFTFEDRGGRSLTLRPEGTASVVRAYCENGDFNRLSTAKFFYYGPMFRAEDVQRGRLRQFNQLGAEFFGSDEPYYDFESISMMDKITRDLKIENYELVINSIGCDDCRPEYVKELQKYYQSHEDKLCEDCKKRLVKNPLRLLDCKQEGCKSLKEGSPKISDYLCQNCEDHHGKLKGYLDDAKISYREDPYLVRGLDYYSKTTFEFMTTGKSGLGSQNTFAAGGRYNKLVEVFGGKPTPAVGFAAGIERLYLILENNPINEPTIDGFFVHYGEEALKRSITLLNQLRDAGLSVDIDPTPKGFKAQMKKVDRENAKSALIIGEDELADNSVMVKNMESGEQVKVSVDELADFLRK